MKKDLYYELNENADIMYQFVMMYGDYIRTVRDYGTGEKIGMVEVHTLTFIADNPGVQIGRIAQLWNRTDGAVSQTVAKLVSRGLVEKRRGENGKHRHCYATPAGQRLAEAHKKYDVTSLESDNRILSEHFTEDELSCFYRIMRTYIDEILKPASENT